MKLLSLVACALCLAGTNSIAAVEAGHRKSVDVQGATRIDWVFAVANQSPAEPPADWLPKYDSTQQKYELFVPPKHKPAQAAPLLLFISPSKQPTGLAQWKSVCEEHGLIFASPFEAGNECDTRQRVRIVLDVLDDVRRRYAIDPDRTYIGGFSGGGRIACAIAFSLPEYFGGIVPICAAGDLRDETWLKHRVQARLSVAHLTGETDFNRGEIERYRGPLLADVGVRSKVWTIDGLGHAIPGSKSLDTAYRWLEEGLKVRQTFAQEFPASRVDSQSAFTREEFAAALSAEAKQRVANPATYYSGLMQYKGIYERWPGLPVALAAIKVLRAADEANPKTWEVEDIAEQRVLLVSGARRLSDYALGPLPPQYAAQRGKMAEAALKQWQLVVADGQDAQAVADSKEIVPKLQAIAEGIKP